MSVSIKGNLLLIACLSAASFLSAIPSAYAAAAEDVDDPPAKKKAPKARSAEDVDDKATRAGKADSSSSLSWYRPDDAESFRLPRAAPPPARVAKTDFTLDASMTTRAFAVGSVHGANTEFDVKLGIGVFGVDAGIIFPGTRPIIGLSVGQRQRETFSPSDPTQATTVGECP